MEGEVDVRPPAVAASSLGLPLAAVHVRVVGGLWEEEFVVRRARAGELVSAELARRAMNELFATGRVADARAFVERPTADAAVLVIEVVPRRLVAGVTLSGSPLPADTLESSLGLREDDEVTAYSLERVAEAAERTLGEAGYPDARVVIVPEETDDPLRVLLSVRVEPGPPRRIASLAFEVAPSPPHPETGALLRSYAVSPGARQDVAALKRADEELQARLRERGFYDAVVAHRLRGPGDVVVRVQAGPKYRVRIEGNRTFDAERLFSALELGERKDHSPEVLAGIVRRYYVDRGFLDVEVSAEKLSRQGGKSSELVLRVRERERVRVVRRLYPCLGAAKQPTEIGREIDGVLGEELPTPGVVDAPNARLLDETVGPNRSSTSRVERFRDDPWSTYSPAAYERASRHVEEVLRAQGYLDARVGPVTLVRRACDQRSSPSRCIPLGQPKLPDVECGDGAEGAIGRTPTETCRPDPSRGVRCEPEAIVVLPVRTGRQAVLYDVEFEGNRALTEAELTEELELDLGQPVSTAELEAARRRILERYAEEAYAFADVELELELSPDHTRAHVRYTISEREPVYVSRVVVVGANRTRESLIRKRLALAPGDLYRQSAVTRTQEQIETLGTFTSVSVGLEDPSVPAREKVVVVTVSERMPQYVDVKGGFSTGEGFRVGFEYGHRNLGGNAIQLTLRAQLGFRPPALIFEPDVRAKYEELTFEELLERRNSVTLAFPDVGLGPLYRLSLEGLDVRDNARDFGLTKDAVFAKLLYRPTRELWFQVGASVELNEANIFGDEGKDALENYVRDNPRFAQTVRVPEGRSNAYAQSLSGAWDRRDRGLDATRGTLVSASVEHVTAIPVNQAEGRCNEGSSSVFAATCSELLRYTNRVAGYLPLGDQGVSLAVSFQWGYIQHLTSNSRTYPDRLFFMGGVDTIRGYLQDSLVPQDIADQLLDPSSGLSIDAVVLRGGDVFLNPRLELRIPLGGSVSTALFVDSGNLWSDPTNMNPAQLRYAVGTGLRIGTPVGPLVFDYGFNVERVLDAFDSESEGERYWEDIGAFHFSIGLF